MRAVSGRMVRRFLAHQCHGLWTAQYAKTPGRAMGLTTKHHAGRGPGVRAGYCSTSKRANCIIMAALPWVAERSSVVKPKS